MDGENPVGQEQFGLLLGLLPSSSSRVSFVVASSGCGTEVWRLFAERSEMGPWSLPASTRILRPTS